MVRSLTPGSWGIPSIASSSGFCASKEYTGKVVTCMKFYLADMGTRTTLASYKRMRRTSGPNRHIV
jgi:hypothetical protein